ncbi:helix-turn-helix domain-containing protein [Cryptosporangium aurantiacum]|uniref:Helix-turn-helix domain-containing protein n=1 Tax=Cryptosporangium aurantiacum TaxID=134849 RepID=A0A1M7RE49_9ACTN|nr:helix-turn-helix domain-containing protein [Cryptosporangium aurantiacum]SHN44419.1 Helix-turn-helix domain-containing protein [Cryptosporangium aurantiacum]
MTAVTHWTGREARALREALRLSIRDFADRLGVAARTISNWESAGAGIRPRPDMQAVLDTALARASVTERDRFSYLLTGTDDPDVDLLTPDPAPDAPLPALTADDLSKITAALEDARHYFDGDVVRQFGDRLRMLARDDGSWGPRTALPAALGLVGAIDRSARSVRSDVRRQLLGVGARAAEFTGWLYRDAGGRTQASYWRDRATEWAQEAGDLAMQGYVLLRKSQAAWDDRDAPRMLTLARAVQEGPWQLPDRVRAEAAQQEARAQAMLGAHLPTIQAKLYEAEELLAVGGEVDADELGATYAYPLFSVQSALCYCEAGEPERALESHARWQAYHGFSRRDRAYFLSLMGTSLARAGQPEEAARVGLAAHDTASEISSSRIRAELRRLVGVLRRGTERPLAVQRLFDTVRSWAR